MSKEKLPLILSKELIVKLFESIYSAKVGVAMFIALICGLRVYEVCRLEIKDINLQSRQIIIRNSKNPNRSKEGYGKDRIIPIPQIAISPIKKWLSVIEGQSKWFLPSDKSNELYMSKRFLEARFSEARQRAGLDSVEYNIPYKTGSKIKGRRQYNIKFHSLRHFYANYVYDKTRDLYVVSGLLGHNQVTTTQIYAKVNDKIKKESVDFSFNIPVRTKIFEQNPITALNFNIPTIAKERTPIQILEERFARGEISASDFQTALRLLKVKKDYFENESKETDNSREIETN